MQAIARPIARAAPRQVRAAAALSTWSNVPAGPPDPILGEYSRRRVDRSPGTGYPGMLFVFGRR